MLPGIGAVKRLHANDPEDDVRRHAAGRLRLIEAAVTTSGLATLTYQPTRS